MLYSRKTVCKEKKRYKIKLMLKTALMRINQVV